MLPTSDYSPVGQLLLAVSPASAVSTMLAPEAEADRLAQLFGTRVLRTL